jgi:SnoaL-like protein
VNQQVANHLVTAYVDGWKNNNPQQVLSTLNPACLIIESHGPTYQGHNHVLQWITTWFQEGGQIQEWNITSFVYAANMAAFEWRFECSGSWGSAVFDGATIVRFKDNLISYLREYRCTTPPYEWEMPSKDE